MPVSAGVGQPRSPTVSKRVKIPRLAPLRLGAAVLVCSLLAPGLSQAQDDVATIAARERFKEGVGYFDAKEYEKARAAFLQAYALKRHPAVLLNLAQSEVRSGHERDAAEHFSAYLREAADASPAEREAAEAGLATAKASVAELKVTSAEMGAEVHVDGTLAGTIPLPGPIFLDPGSHQLELRKGTQSSTRSVTAKAGERSELNLTLTPAAAEAPKPAAQSESTGTRTSEPTEPGSAPATEQVETGGREPFVTWVTTRPTGFIPAGATVLLALGSGGLAFAAKHNYDEADSTADKIAAAAADDGIPTRGVCTDPELALAGVYEPQSLPVRAKQYRDACNSHQDRVDSGDQFQLFATIAGIGAGAALATTIVLYFTTAPREQAAQQAPRFVGIVPYVAPGAGGLAVSGTF
jgi:tetratricopeptide (TPR) repeat protein